MSFELFQKLNRRFGDVPDAFNRRQMLQASIAGAMGLMLSRPGYAAVRDETDPVEGSRHVVVIGGGLAGLSAAYELNAVGYNVTVVEARNRLGGRVLSHSDLVPGKIVEGGAELIGANHPLWLAYAKRFDIKFRDVLEEDEAATPIMYGGRRLTEREAKNLWRELREAHRLMDVDAASVDAFEPWNSPLAEKLDRLTTAAWIDGLETSDLCKLALTVGLTSENGVHTGWQSYLGNLAMIKGGGLEKYWTDTNEFTCAGGNQQLAYKFAEALSGQRLILGAPVTKVSVREEKVSVTIAGGERIVADDVILAVPPTVWNRISFDPALPVSLAPQMGTNVKFLAACTHRFWRETKRSARCISDGPVSTTWEGTDKQRGHNGACLTVFAGGSAADIGREWAPEERVENYLKALEVFFPDIRKHFERSRFMNWPSDPWSKGSYSFPAPGQITTLGPVLHKGLGRLHFAGEHTCYAFIGYMEGALQSGVRTARLIAERDGVEVATDS